MKSLITLLIIMATAVSSASAQTTREVTPMPTDVARTTVAVPDAGVDTTVTSVPIGISDSTEVSISTVDSVATEVGKHAHRHKRQKKVRPFGIAVGADFVGVGMKVAGCDWSQMEVLARINIKDKYFPIFEMGLGEADHEGRETDNRFKTRAPYFRIGADYNFTKKHNGNRLFLGLRYGFSAYNYDFTSASPLTDPVWGDSHPINFTGLDGRSHWAEVMFGLETRLWSIVRMGWDIRLKFRLHDNVSSIGDPWYIPGYGKTDSSTTWGGTFKLLFDI